MKELMIDYKTIKENIKVMEETRDLIGKLPDADKLKFATHLSEENQELIIGMCEGLSNAYTVLDVCSYGIEVLTKQLSIEEATSQFKELYKDNLYYEAKSLKVQEIMLNVHSDCLRANNLLKDGE
jgi:DNA polymerase III gamma/tau subunit